MGDIISIILFHVDPSQQQWPSSVYPNLGLTESDSVSLIWTYRDNKIVNLPWNLLVDGDVIILGPSRVAPAGCRQVSVAEILLKVVQENLLLGKSYSWNQFNLLNFMQKFTSFTSTVKRTYNELTLKFSICAIQLFSKTFSCDEFLGFFSHADLFMNMMMQLIVNDQRYRKI